MKPETIEAQRQALPTTEHAPVKIREVTIGWRSRFVTWLMRRILRPMLKWAVHGSYERLAGIQLQVAGQLCKDSSGLPLDYVVLGRCPGHFLGKVSDTHRNALLYLHGGAFILPAAPDVHVRFVSKLCRDLDAVGFVADYRLAPFNKFPAALDDCERAYRALLDLGYDPSRIVIGGESAGGNLTLGVLQRIRKHGLPMPSCALVISPATELGRIHAPPSRILKMKSDPILPIASLQRVDDMYAGDWDASDPELSPLYADLKGFPPMYLMASDSEVLLDDTVLLARRAREAGIEAKLDVWPILPHAFPLFEQFMPEVKQGRLDLVEFARTHLARRAAAAAAAGNVRQLRS